MSTDPSAPDSLPLLASSEEVVVQPITGELDLHTFRPNELGALLPAYLTACQEAGLGRVRIIHGKGTGTLQAGVHRLLANLPMVERYFLADASTGGWGATWAVLRKPGLSAAQRI